jgi:flagellar basal-body rod modification protein FlgD
MAISSVSDSSWWKEPTTSKTDSSSGSSSISDFESFVQLLATELKYQDPTDPVSNTEYVSQMAQISTLEQMNNLTESYSVTQAYSMIGKNVMYGVTDATGATVYQAGKVESVITQKGTTYLLVNGTLVELSSVLQVSNSNTDSAMSQAFAMIGKEVSYETEEDGETVTLSGVVDSVIIKGGIPYLSIDGEEVEVGSVVKVSNPSDSAGE